MNLPANRLKLISTFLSFALVLGSASGCQNALSESADKNSNAAVYFDAQKLLSARDYDTAISKLLSLTGAFRTRHDVVVTTASAYAGRCGLDMIGLVDAISSNPGTRLFPLLLSKYKTAAAGNIADCAQAETLIRSLAPSDNFASLSGDENVFLAFLSLVKVGAILATYADLDDDGVADGTFDSCNTTKLPDAKARDLGTGITLAMAALTASGAPVAGAALSGFTTACASLPAPAQFCTIYDPAAFSANMVKAINGLVRTQDYVGLGTCADTLANCVCP